MNTVGAVLASCLLAAMAANVAHAEDGTVIWKNYECGYFILQMKGGYGLYEWAAGPYPNDSDVFEGDLKSAGEHKVNNKTADVPTSIYLDTFSAKRSAISARIPAKCKSRPGYVPFEGQ
jgi:hypothetical protein